MSAGNPELHNEDCKQNRRRGVRVLPGTNSSFRMILSEKFGKRETFLGVNNEQTATFDFLKVVAPAALFHLLPPFRDRSPRCGSSEEAEM